MTGPKHTFESVVSELREGLENGAITLDCGPEVGETESFICCRESLNLSEELLKTFLARETDLACRRGVQDDKAEVRSYIFITQTKTGGLFTRTKKLHLSVTFIGNEVKYLAGDVSEIQKFNLPPEIKKAIDDSVAAANTIIPMLCLNRDKAASFKPRGE
jgi:hypothetical protein